MKANAISAKMRSKSTMENGRAWLPTATRVGRSITGARKKDASLLHLLQLVALHSTETVANRRMHSLTTISLMGMFRQLYLPSGIMILTLA